MQHLQTCQVFKNIRWEYSYMGRGYIRLACPECANVAKIEPKPKGVSFLGGLSASFPRKFNFFILEKHSETIKQKITSGVGKTKRDISEI